MVSVRVLESSDAPAFQAVRLRSLKEHPEAFGSSYEEEADRDVQEIAKWLGISAENVMFGAFDGEQLIGIANLNRTQRVKTRHRANLGAMYVAPEGRGQGVGQALMEATIDQAHRMDGVEDVVLAVTVGNDAARRVYIKAGFEPYSIDPRYIRVGDHYFDIEWMILRLEQHG